MATLPTTLGDALPTPVSQRTVQGYDSQTLPNAQYQAGKALQDDALALQEKQNKVAIIKAQDKINQAKQKAADFYYGDGKNPGLYASEGADTLNAQEKSKTFLQGLRSETLAGVDNPVAQRALNTELSSMETSYADSTGRFQMEGTKNYRLKTIEASDKINAEGASLEYNNQAAIDKREATARTTADSLSKINGIPQGSLIWKQNQTERVSGVLAAQLDAMSKSKDPNVLMQFNTKYDEYRKAGNLTLDAVDKFDAVREKIAPTIEAVKARADDNHSQLTYQAPDDKVLEALHGGRSQAESGGKQFGGPGSVAGPNEPTTSPKGAIGISQIMPDTGPEAAKLAGLPWDENKFRNDAGYNQKLGDAYYLEQKKRFGDTRMALMAYNAGPTIMQDWIDGTNKSEKNPDKLKIGDPAKGQVSVDQFITQVPNAETRAYPGKVLKNAGYTGSIGPMDMAVARERATRMTPDGAKVYLEMVERDNAAYFAQIDQARKQTMDAAFQYMADQGAGYRLMPPQLQAQIDSAGLTQGLKDYNPTKASDSSTLMYLMNLPAKKLSEVDLNTPDIRLNLSPVDYSKWKQRQQNMSTAGAQVADSFMQRVLRDGFTRRGVSVKTHYDPDTGEAITEGGQDYIRAHDLLNQSIDAYAQENGGRMPDGAAIQKMGDQIFTKIIVPQSHWLWPDTKQEIDKYGITRDKITGKEEQIILNILKENGDSPTDQKVIALYIKRHDG